MVGGKLARPEPAPRVARVEGLPVGQHLGVRPEGDTGTQGTKSIEYTGERIVEISRDAATEWRRAVDKAVSSVICVSELERGSRHALDIGYRPPCLVIEYRVTRVSVPSNRPASRVVVAEGVCRKV